MSERAVHHQAAIDLLRQTVQTASTRTVFGEPINRGDVTVLPVARVRVTGAGGGGGGGAGLNEGGGAGSGYATSATPLGVLVLDANGAQWKPIFDLNRVVLGGQLVGIAALFAVRALIKACRR